MILSLNLINSTPPNFESNQTRSIVSPEESLLQELNLEIENDSRWARHSSPLSTADIAWTSLTYVVSSAAIILKSIIMQGGTITPEQRVQLHMALSTIAQVNKQFHSVLDFSRECGRDSDSIATILSLTS